MSIAKCLPDVVDYCLQVCPLCNRANRIVVKGVFVSDGKRELYPDIGYSFCNCKSIFYTNYENIKIHTHAGFQHYKKPLEELKRTFDALPSGNQIEIVMPDPFFCEWGGDPYTFYHWNPRFNHVLFDMEKFCEDAEEIGFEVLSAKRQMDLQSENQKTMEIVLRKP